MVRVCAWFRCHRRRYVVSRNSVRHGSRRRPSSASSVTTARNVSVRARSSTKRFVRSRALFPTHTCTYTILYYISGTIKTITDVITRTITYNIIYYITLLCNILVPRASLAAVDVCIVLCKRWHTFLSVELETFNLREFWKKNLADQEGKFVLENEGTSVNVAGRIRRELERSDKKWQKVKG